MARLPRNRRHHRSRDTSGSNAGPLGDLGLGDIEFEFSVAFFMKMLRTRPGDCITILLCIPILFYLFPPTRPLGLAVVYPSYNTTDATEAESAEFSVGTLDVLFLAFVTGFAYVLHEAVRDLLFRRLAKMLAVDRYQQLTWQFTACDVVAHILNLLFIVQTLAWLVQEATSSISWLWEGFPHSMPYGIKTQQLVNIGYFAFSAQLVNAQKNAQLGKKKTLELARFLVPALHAVAFGAAYLFMYNRLAVLLLTSYHALYAVVDVYAMLRPFAARHNRGKDTRTWFKSQATFGLTDLVSILKKAAPIAKGLYLLVTLAVSAYTLFVALPASETESPLASVAIRSVVFGLLSLSAAGPIAMPALFLPARHAHEEAHAVTPQPSAPTSGKVAEKHAQPIQQLAQKKRAEGEKPAQAAKQTTATRPKRRVRAKAD